MTELSPEAKKLLEAAREGFSPTDAQVTAARGALEARIHLARGGGGGVGGGAAGWASYAPHLIGIAALAIGIGAAVRAVVPRESASDVEPGARSSGEVSSSSPSTMLHAAPAATQAAVEKLPAEGALRVNSGSAASTASARAPESQREPDRTQAAVVTPSQRAPRSTPRAIARAPHAAFPERAREPSRAAATSPSSTTRNSPAPADAEEAAPRAQSETASPERATPLDEPAASARPRADESLAREITLLRNARAALDRGDPRAALAIADQYAAQFASGTMRQEQLATRALALCALKRRSEAIAVKHELERIAPRSPHLMQIRTSCAQEDAR